MSEIKLITQILVTHYLLNKFSLKHSSEVLHGKELLLHVFQLSVFIWNSTVQARNVPSHVLGAGSRVLELLMFAHGCLV